MLRVVELLFHSYFPYVAPQHHAAVGRAEQVVALQLDAPAVFTERFIQSEVTLPCVFQIHILGITLRAHEKSTLSHASSGRFMALLKRIIPIGLFSFTVCPQNFMSKNCALMPAISTG